MPRVTISEPGKTPQPYRFKLERKIVKIGRGSDNDILIECGSASTNHCVMERIEGGHVLRDLGSTNGIKLDDTLMEVIDLYDGMEVLIGDVPFKFQLSDDEIEKMGDEKFTSQQKKKLPPAKNNAEDDSPKASTSSPRSSHRHQPVVQESGGAMKTFFVFILVLVAIFAGMTIRHSMRTGDFLPSKIMGNEKETSKKPEKSADEAEVIDEDQATDDPGM